MSSMRHGSDLVLREDSLTRVTTGRVQLCKPAVKQTLGMSDEKVYDFSVSIERGRYQTVVRICLRMACVQEGGPTCTCPPSSSPRTLTRVLLATASSPLAQLDLV